MAMLAIPSPSETSPGGKAPEVPVRGSDRVGTRPADTVASADRPGVQPGLGSIRRAVSTRAWVLEVTGAGSTDRRPTASAPGGRPRAAVAENARAWLGH